MPQVKVRLSPDDFQQLRRIAERQGTTLPDTAELLLRSRLAGERRQDALTLLATTRTAAAR